MHGCLNRALTSKDRFQWDSAFDLSMSHSRPDVTWMDANIVGKRNKKIELPNFLEWTKITSNSIINVITLMKRKTHISYKHYMSDRLSTRFCFDMVVIKELLQKIVVDGSAFEVPNFGFGKWKLNRNIFLFFFIYMIHCSK